MTWLLALLIGIPLLGVFAITSILSTIAQAATIVIFIAVLIAVLRT